MDSETSDKMSEGIDDANMETELSSIITDGEGVEMIQQSSTVIPVVVESEGCKMDVISFQTEQTEGNNLTSEGNNLTSEEKDQTVEKPTDTCMLNIEGEAIVVETNSSWDDEKEPETNCRNEEKSEETDCENVTKSMQSENENIAEIVHEGQHELASRNETQQLTMDSPVPVQLVTSESIAGKDSTQPDGGNTSTLDNQTDSTTLSNIKAPTQDQSSPAAIGTESLSLHSIAPIFHGASKSSLANVSLDSLVNMIKTTVDDWRKDNPLQPLSNETESLRQDAQLLCDKFSASGEEAIFVVVNKSDSVTSYQGTKTGMSFLDERSDVLDDFLDYCKEKDFEQKKGKRKKDNSRKNKSKSKDKRARSDRTEEIVEDHRGMDSCTDNESDLEADVGRTPIRKRASEGSSARQNEGKAKRQKMTRNTTPNDSDMEGYEEKTQEETKSGEYLPRSSRKVKLPSWRKDYGTLMIDYSTGGQQSGSPTQRSSIPKFSLEGKYVKLETSSAVKGELVRYSCLQCRSKVVISNLRRHWEKHESEDGVYTCKWCKKIFKALRYLQIHDLLDHEGLTELTFCKKCDERFPSEGLLIQHFVKVHKKRYPASSKGLQQSDKSTTSVESSKKPSPEKLILDEAACDLCSKKFACEANLQRHKKLAHITEVQSEKIQSPKAASASGKKSEKTNSTSSDSEEEWSCHLCRNTYKLYRNLQQHLSEKHHIKKDLDDDEEEEDITITCQSCDKSFDQHRMYTAHLNSEHHGKGSKTVKSSMWIRKQKTSHCLECNMTFGKPEFLQKHNKTVHVLQNSSDKVRSPVIPTVPTKNGYPYCKDCERTFARNINYYQHMSFAHNVKVKKCDTPKQKQKSAAKIEAEKDRDTDLVMNDDTEKDPDLGMNDDTKKDPDFYQQSDSMEDMSNDKSKAKKGSISPVSEEDIKTCFVKLKDFGDRVDLETLKCKICFRIFKSPLRLFQHMERHDSQAHTCAECGQQCATPFRLKEHMRKHSQGLPCQFCDRSYMHQRNLNRHYMKLHKMKHCIQCSEIFPLTKMSQHFEMCKPKSGQVRCRICWQIFKDKNTLEAHLERHRKRIEKAKLKRAFLICKICNYKCETREVLVKHVISSHPDRMESHPMQTGRSGDGILKCKTCFKEFYTQETFALHQAAHTEKTYKCESCRAKFTTAYALKLHSKIHLKPGQAVFHQCRVCNKTFLRRNSLTIHMFSHRSTKDFTCSECGKSFRLRATLRSHLRVHNKFYFYICKCCGKKFRARSTFRNHILASHREDEEAKKFPIFKCEYCAKEYVSKYRYEEHVTQHTGEKLFACSLCPAKFAIQGKLNWHINNVHMRKRKFMCKVCHVSCENEAKFKKHLQSASHIEECKAANIEIKQFFDDLESLREGIELSDPRVTFDVILDTSEKGRRREVNPKRKDCTICNKKFITLKALYKHKKERHTYCSVCNVSFKSSMLFHKHIGRKFHIDTCRNMGIDPEAFLFCFKSDGVIEEGEQPEDDTDYEHLTATASLDGPTQSKLSSEIVGQLMDHQYQTQEGIPQNTAEPSQNLQGSSQNNSDLRSILTSNQSGMIQKQGASTNLKISQNIPVISGNQQETSQNLLKTPKNLKVMSVNFPGTSGNVQRQKTSQSQQVASQSQEVATQSQQVASQSLLGSSQILATEQTEGSLVIADKVQQVEDVAIEDSVMIEEAQQAVEVLSTMSEDNMEYVLITIPSDSLTVTEDGTYLLNDTVLSDVLK